MFTNSLRHFDVTTYKVSGDPLLTNLALTASLGHRTGTNLTLMDLLQTAAELQRNYRDGGYTNVTIAIRRDQITNSTVTMNVFRGSRPQILVDGLRCSSPSADTAAYLDLPRATNYSQTVPTAGTAKGGKPDDTSIGPVRAYEIAGDTLLPMSILTSILTNYIGTNVTVEQVTKAGTELQMEYQRRGYQTVRVTIPPQRITNSMVKIRVFEGRLSDIEVVGNRYFSSNNVMRALPSLHTNIILNGTLFQAELDRANANQDRQIYPQIEPGEEINTTALRLEVHDRLPLHAKMELNNQNSPGTPELRLNSSATYNNLWQLEHSLGVQYSFSPETYKSGDQWAFYDLPLVANYSAFYRLPLGNPGSIEQGVAANPGSFGYDEATRKFRLPAQSGRPELNLYASRSTIDTGVQSSPTTTIFSVPGVRQVTESDSQQDITTDETAGFRLGGPLSQLGNWRSSWSAGADIKAYDLVSRKTNSFQFTEVHVLEDGTAVSVVSEVHSPSPEIHHNISYLPFALRYDGNLRDSLGSTAFGLGFSANSWYSGSLSNLHGIAGSTQSSGHWVVLSPSLSRDFMIFTNWTLSARADGQWASEPLISNERFGVGGINSVRGYHEGEIFGDTGWHVSLDQKTPGHVVGRAYDNTPMIIRGVIYMDYAEAYLLDPHGAKARIPLWGTGIGGVLSVGPHWDARFLFSFPLLSAGTVEAMQPRFDFSLSAQF